MLLALDIGNTNIVIGVHDGKTWTHHWRIRTVEEKMPDEYRVLFHTLLQEDGLDWQGYFDQTVVCSVVPPLTTGIAEMIGRQTGINPLIIDHTVEMEIHIDVDNAYEVGSDLIADASAAYARYRDACIVVDFGTATTLTAVSPDGGFLGVSIAPGIKLAASALAGGTAQLPHIEITPPPSVIGTNTINSIQSGIVYGYVGLLEGLIKRIYREAGWKERPQVIATGGLANLLAPLTDSIDEVDQQLTIEGIRLIAGKNRR
ncbi:MAG: type III pantothenate kinase [Spirochaetales bacterium]|nr:type III pantothenate kinase [Spirochaetales bacterium]MCF7939002.1 type III pantothenate kinase [Spirochaetales bacterium]